MIILLKHVYVFFLPESSDSMSPATDVTGMYKMNISVFVMIYND